MEKDFQDNYRTKDLAEASFLISKGMQLYQIEKEGRICWFIFEDREQCSSLAKKFWFGDSTTSAKAFYDAMQTLKNHIFSGL